MKTWKLLLVTLLMGTVATMAEEPATEQFSRMKYGLFSCMWNASSGGPGKSMDEWLANFDIDQYIADVVEMDVEYVIFVNWHYAVNPIYPSDVIPKYREAGKKHVPGSDVLGKIIRGLETHGIKTLLYSLPTGMQKASSADQAGTGYGDPTDNYKKHNDFLNELYDEVGKRYGKDLFGHWIDQPYWGQVNGQRLGEVMRKHHPDVVIVINNRRGIFPDPKDKNYEPDPYGENVFYASEWKTCVSLKPDDPMVTWDAIDGQVCNIYGMWWDYHGGSTGGKLSEKDVQSGKKGFKLWPGHARYTPEQIVRYTAFQASCSRGGGIAWAAGINRNGHPVWEIKVKENLVEASRLMKPFREAICNTLRGKSWTTPVRTKVPDLPWGGTATESPDGKYTYLSIFHPPEGKTLTLPPPEDGATFTAATVLQAERSEAKLEQDAKGVRITIPGEWDPVLPVIRLTRSGRDE